MVTEGKIGLTFILDPKIQETESIKIYRKGETGEIPPIYFEGNFHKIAQFLNLPWKRIAFTEIVLTEGDINVPTKRSCWSVTNWAWKERRRTGWVRLETNVRAIPEAEYFELISKRKKK